MMHVTFLERFEFVVYLSQPVVPLFLHFFAILRRSNLTVHLLHDVCDIMLHSLKLLYKKKNLIEPIKNKSMIAPLGSVVQNSVVQPRLWLSLQYNSVAQIESYHAPSE